MRGQSAAGMLAIVLAGTVTGCTGTGEPARPVTRASATTPVSAGGSQPLGAAGCRPASPLIRWHGFLPQVEGTGRGATLWGLLMFAHALPARAGDQEKIVWRMTGTGPLTLTAIGPDGTRHRLAWGPDPHGSSTWDKPGAEWGAGYVFTAPGCWDLRATRGHATADVWLRVVAR